MVPRSLIFRAGTPVHVVFSSSIGFSTSVCTSTSRRADLGVFPEDYLDAVAEELNGRLWKTLGYRKPSEAMLGLINDSSWSESEDSLKVD